MTASPSIARLFVTVLVPFGLGYFMSYLYRSVNAVIAPNLVAEIGLIATDLGFLTAVYFLSFSAMQLPLGIALDRLGPRRVQGALMLVASAGALYFSFGQSRAELAVARALIGIGVAGGLMASLKAITLWFPKERWPLVNGIFMSMGGLGALVATQPVESALHVLSWREVFQIAAAANVLVGILIFLAVPERRGQEAPAAVGEQLRGLKRIFADPLFWRLAPLCFFNTGAGMAIQGLWAGPWLMDVAGFDRDGTAQRLFAIAIAMTVGFLTNGIYADLMSRRGVPVVVSMRLALTVLLAVYVVIALQLDPGAYWPWIVFGLLSNVSAFVFPIISGHFPVEFAGRATTGLNVFVFGGAFAVQFAIGRMLDFWQAVDGHYPAEAYRFAFAVIVGLQILAFAWSMVPVRRAQGSAAAG